ncbi:MAG: hypothetical protein IJ111_04605 [Eggerthellaceae bacterium]|nr:hypothetical protein [Eggerthellaceae bacterium]
MKMSGTKFASVVLSMVLALNLVPASVAAANTGSDAQSDTTGADFVPAIIVALQTSDKPSLVTQDAEDKPSQAIQATSMSVFKTDTDKKVSAKVVEGDGALSYTVKSGSESYIAVNKSTGDLTIKGVPSNNEAYITVTAAETESYAQTSVDVPIKIYETYEHTINLWTVQYAVYNSIYNLSSLDIKLFDKSGTEVGKATVDNPRYGSTVTIPATNYADRVEMTAHIQLPKREPFTLTGSGGIGGSIDVWNKTSYSGRVFTCNYGMNAPEPEYTAPVAKPNLTANGADQILIYPGSVSVGGQMQYCLGTETEPNNNWSSGLGYIRKKDPGTYYVWWRTHNTDYYTARYIGQGRSEMEPQRIVATIGEGTISPTVNIEGWTYGETPKTPTVTGNAGNGTVTYDYKVKGASDDMYSEIVPSDAGDYTVRATIADTTSYSGGTATADFTISKGTLQPQDVRVAGVMSSSEADQAWKTSITQSLASMVPNNAGSPTYMPGKYTYKVNGTEQNWPSGFTFSSTVNSSNGDVNADLQITKAAAEKIENVDQVGEIILPVTVTSQNYNDATINVVVMPTARTVQDVTITGVPNSVTYGDGAFKLAATLKNSDEEVETRNGDWYWYSSDPKVLEVDAVNGSNQMQVHVRGAGSAQIMAWYEPSGGTTIGAAVTDSIKVNKKSISPSVSIKDWKYGEAPKAPSVSGNDGNGAVAYSYSGTTRGEMAFGPSADAPTHAGTYTVTATVAETDNYFGGTSTPATFTIAPKSVPVTVIAQDKTYDGTDNADVTAAMKASYLVDGDLLEGAVVYEDGMVAFPGLKGTFNDANAGQNKPITLDIGEVTYPVANVADYEATISKTPAASILPRPVYVKANDQESKHGDAIVPPTYGLVGSATLVGDDAITSLGVTASTTASSSSDVGTYPITLSGGTANSNYKVYFVEGGTYTITQAEGLTKSIRVVGVLSSNDATGAWVADITQPLAGMMPSDAGTLTYAAGTNTMPTGVESYSVDSSSGEVTARLQIKPTSDGKIPSELKEITLPVTVTSQNYKSSTINVVVVPTLRTEKQVIIEAAPASKTYGDGAFTLTAIVKDGDDVVQTKEGDWYWYSSDPNVLFVPEVAEGYSASSTMSVTVVNPGSAMIMAWYEPVGGNTIGAALTDSITVKKKSISPSVSIEGWEYGEALNAPVLTEGSNPGECAVTYEYKAKGADDDTYSTDVPTDAGEYTVRATVLESTYYEGGTCTADFTIAKKPVNATVTAEDKTYDGTADANVSATVGEGVLEGDSVTVSGLIGTFADAKAGVDKTVTVDRTSMTTAGEGAANYEVAIPATTTATIEKRPIVVKADDKSSCYGDAIAELTYSLDGSGALAEGDTLASLGIIASTTATSSSDLGEYPITLSGGTANPNYEVTFGENGTYAIVRASYYVTEGSGSSYTVGDNEGLTFTFKRSVNDGGTFKHFTGIRVDGADVAASNFDAVPGSVVVTLHPAFLKTLAPGEHTIAALFDDGDPAQASFTVKAAPASATKASGSRSAIAKTGDALPVSTLAALALAAFAAVSALYARRQKR